MSTGPIPHDEIVEATPDFIGTATPDGRVLFLNGSARDMCGLGPEVDESQFKISDFQPQWAVAILVEQAFPEAEKNGTWTGETALLDTHGNEVPVTQVIAAHKDENGHVTYFSTITHDISTTKTLQCDLLARTRAMDTSITGMVLANPDGTLVYANRAFAKMWGEATADQVIGRSYDSFFADRSEAQAVMESLLQDDFYYGEFTGKRRDESKFTVLFSASVVRDSNGVPQSLMGTFTDITERKQAQAHSARAADRFRALLSSTMEGFCLLDNDGFIVETNERASALTGYTRSELVGMHMRQLTAKGSVVRAAVHARRIRTQGYERFRVRMQHKEGITIDVELSAAYSPGTDARFFVFFRDVSSELQLEAAKQDRDRAMALNKAKNALLSNVNHEINTPLNAIRGFAQILEHENDLPKYYRDMAREIDESAVRLHDLTRNLLTLAELERGDVETSESTVHTKSFIGLFAERYRSQSTHKNLDFHLEQVDPLPAAFRTDHQKLYQILTQVLDNAVKFTSSGCITFRVESIDREEDAGLVVVRFQVCDTGPGIPSDELQSILTPFHQALPDGFKPRGAGLGLPIAKQLASVLGGDLAIKSVPGSGTEVTIDVPCRIHVPGQGTAPAQEVVPASVDPHTKSPGTSVPGHDQQTAYEVTTEEIRNIRDMAENGDIEACIEFLQPRAEHSTFFDTLRQKAQRYEIHRLLELLDTVRDN